MALGRFLERMDDKLHDIKRSITGDTYEQDKEFYNQGYDPQPQGAELGRTPNLIRMERGIFGPRMIANSPGYERVAHNRDVRSLLNDTFSFEAQMKSKKLPPATDNMTDFRMQLATVNGEVITLLQNMIDKLVAYSTTFADKSSRYQTIMGICANAATHMRDQMDFVNRIQELGLNSADQNDLASFPVGASYESVLLDPNRSGLAMVGESAVQGVVGNGQLNTVLKVSDSGKIRAMKTGSVRIDTKNGPGDEILGKLQVRRSENADTTQEVNTSYRDAAVSVVNRLFGLHASVGTSLARNAMAGGSQASIMDMAEGQEAGSSISYFGEEERPLAMFKLALKQNATLFETGASSPDQLTGAAAKTAKERAKIRAVDISTDDMMESSMEMAALDMIVGHVDRHAGNYMLAQGGRFTAIDNDTSFSLRKNPGLLGKSMSDFEMQDLDRDSLFHKREGATGTGGMIQLQNEDQALLFYDTAFPFISDELFKKLTSVTPEALDSALKGLISQPERAACTARLRGLQDYLRSLPEDIILRPGESFSKEQKRQYATTAYHGFNSKYGNYLAQTYSVFDTTRNKLDNMDVMVIARKIMEQPDIALMLEERKELLTQKYSDDYRHKYLFPEFAKRLYARFQANPDYDLKSALYDPSIKGVPQIMREVLMDAAIDTGEKS